MKAHFILYVADQERSTGFYCVVLGQPPSLDMPGMTEFTLGPDTILGLMPVDGAARLLGNDVVEATNGRQLPRVEVYLVVDDPAGFHERALAAGARELSPLSERDWGHTAAYSLDPDRHVLAFAKEI